MYKRQSQDCGSRNSGIRSWIGASASSASVVTIVKVTSHASGCPGGTARLRQNSYSPASASGVPSARETKNGFLRALPRSPGTVCHS